MRAIGKKIGTDICKGSALILTIVLCTLLALVGMVFLIMSRADRDASSSISQDKQLQSAVDSTIAVISERLAEDVPQAGQEYYDYPDANNAFLASLEPNKVGTDIYEWRRVSDITSSLDANDLQAKIIPDYQDINDVNDGKPADADGDGVADAMWVRLPNVATDRGEPVFAAVRIIDNGGMINVNTGYEFIPTQADGSEQIQINLAQLKRGTDTINELHQARVGMEDPCDLAKFMKNVVWKIGGPNGGYLPFDISDELELRNRFFLTTLADSRLEATWNSTVGSPTFKRVPYDGETGSNVSDWFEKFDPCLPFKPERRHYLTTYNIDRVINPAGAKMVNVNTADESSLRDAINAVLLAAGIADANDFAAQLAVNIKDYRDSDSDVSVLSYNGKDYYGFETPCVYISELAEKFVPDVVDPTTIYRSYAIELYKPYAADTSPATDWQLKVGLNTIPISSWIGSEQLFVLQNQSFKLEAKLDVDSGATTQDAVFDFAGGTVIELQRKASNGNYITVDSVTVPDAGGSWLMEDDAAHSIHRDINLHKCIRKLWASAAEATTPTLGRDNGYTNSDATLIQAHPENVPFKCIGDIGKVFAVDASTIVPADAEEAVRLDIVEPNVAKIFQYLTVFDSNDGKIAGRININTAPWFVIAQLPWMQYEDSNSFARAEAICSYRDKTGSYASRPGEAGFGSIGELMQVSEMLDLGSDGKDNLNSDAPAGPDFTPDTAMDDFEERDLILARVSNLATVRSDVFTAYILVRLSSDGPQRRVVAILDRSGVKSASDHVRIVAVQDVPDPR